ncbi:o-succinylbenzoate synthase [Funiculus sociatus]|uniref:o-succinylbenzoate synthase n=1 Tax=Funiculus sociatus TaxID=450527 RepID=UPI0032997F5D
MPYRFEFRPYQRQFARSLSTNHGTWNIREGIIIRLTDKNGQVGWGEVAPLPWFGSETLEQALDFCRQVGEKITAEAIFNLPAELPACQFGFESAWEDTHFLDKALTPQPSFPSREGGELKAPLLVGKGLGEMFYSGLLPAGEAALHQWQTLWNQGYRTFKWKIGVASIEEELNIFHQLIQALPQEAKLRLDANGGLSWNEANEWLKECACVEIIEFLEQPLRVGEETAMGELRARYSIPIALDESIATLKQIQASYRNSWRGIFVIKPSIVGSPSRLRQFCQQHHIDAVFSSVFETAIGRQAALKLAAELSSPHRTVGFGINHWFNEDEETTFEDLWKRL